jgi:hypothetical protein
MRHPGCRNSQSIHKPDKHRASRMITVTARNVDIFSKVIYWQISATLNCLWNSGRSDNYVGRGGWDPPPDAEYEVVRRSLVLARPKTAAGERATPIVAPLLGKLVELRQAQGANPHGPRPC